MTLLLGQSTVVATFDSRLAHNVLSRSYASSHDIDVVAPVVRLLLVVTEGGRISSIAVDFTLVHNLNVDAILGRWWLEWRMANEGMCYILDKTILSCLICLVVHLMLPVNAQIFAEHHPTAFGDERQPSASTSTPNTTSVTESTPPSGHRTLHDNFLS